MCSIDSGISEASTGELVEVITACAAELAARPAPESTVLCFEQVQTLGGVADLVEAAIASRVAAAERAGEPQRWGYPSTASWLRTGLAMRHSRAEDRAVLARQLARLSQVAKRLAANELSYGYACVIAGAVRRLDDDDAAKAETILLELVDAGCSVKEVTTAGERIATLIAERDGTAGEPEDGRRGERQWWTMHRTSGGRAMTKGLFSPELAALVRAKIEPLAQPVGPEDTRDHAQRMADALHMFLSEGDRRWDPILILELRNQLQQPTSSSTAPPEQRPPLGPAPSGRSTTLDQVNACPALAPDQDTTAHRVMPPRQTSAPVQTMHSNRPGTPSPVTRSNRNTAPKHPTPTRAKPSADADQPSQARSIVIRPGRPSVVPLAPDWPINGTPFTARLPDGTPIPTWRAREILLNAGYSSLIIGTDGHPLYLGRTVRCATPHQRRALVARYPTCVVQGCDIPGALCQIDHVTGWSAWGPTDIDKLTLTCRFHNVYKHEHPDRVDITASDDGRYTYRINHSPYHPRSRHADDRPRDRGP